MGGNPMSEFLLEIFCEEIPARMQKRAGADLTKALTDGFKKAGLSVENVTSFYGPRRLTFAAEIPARSPDISEERKGPRVGSPEQALAGFMRGAGLTDISQAEIRSDKKGDHYVAVIEQAGRDAGEIIAELIPAVMNDFPWPKSMTSGGSNFRWVRPLQKIVCLLEGKVVPFEVGGVQSGNETEGHRRLGKGPYTIKGLQDYVSVLETKGFVVLDAETRAEIILKDAKAACAKKGLELVEDAGLLAEVAGLAEWPVVILGDMDPSFLELPGEVIRLSMRTHQKYFAVKNPKTGKLAPHFIVVANQVAPDGGKAIAEGNSRVLSARLADAQFFQSEDAKKKLIDYYEKLDTVVFHKKLGSIKDKAERVAALAKELAPKVGADPDKAEQAAKLAKCDLVTNMVIEFTSLQGQIGAQMYMAEGGDKDIAVAIEEHYKPQGPSDSVPTNPVAVAVALADKLDTLVGFWAIDEKPTGSKDPFALRRAALGVVRIILENGIRLEFDQSNFVRRVIRQVIVCANETIRSSHMNTAKLSGPSSTEEKMINWWESRINRFDDIGRSSISPIETSMRLSEPEPMQIEREINQNLLAFILDRLKGDLRDKGVRHDIIDAALAQGGDDLVAIVNRVNALQTFLGTSEGADLLAGYKRAANILKAEEKKGVLPDGDPKKATQAEETALFTALTKARPAIEAALAKEDYAGAMGALAGLRGPIDAFFDKVMVVSDVKDERENRLRLLMAIRNTAQQIADFDKLDG